MRIMHFCTALRKTQRPLNLCLMNEWILLLKDFTTILNPTMKKLPGPPGIIGFIHFDTMKKSLRLCTGGFWLNTHNASSLFVGSNKFFYELGNRSDACMV